MAPSLEASVTQAHETPTKRPRRMIPIIPAIPRSLERKPIQEASPVKLEEFPNEVEQTTASTISEENLDTREVIQAASEQDSSHEQSGKRPSTEISGEPQSFSDPQLREGKLSHVVAALSIQALTRINQDTRIPSPSTTKEYGTELQEFQLPPPSYPREFSENDASPNLDTKQEQPVTHEPLESDSFIEDGLSKQEPVAHHKPLRPTAESFFSRSTPPCDDADRLATSPTKVLNHLPGNAVPLQPTPPTNATPSPIHANFRAHGHAHNISFYPPASVVSDDLSSPNRSVYQGHAYGHFANEYSHANFSPSQHSNIYPSQPENFVPSGQHPPPQSFYYTNNIPYPPLGNQPPLTPSATPLDPIPQPWRFSNEHIPGPYTQYGLPPHPHIMGVDPHQRSMSHSTLRSDNIPHRNCDPADEKLPGPQAQPYTYKQWSPVDSNAMQSSWESEPINVVDHLLLNFNKEVYADCQLIPDCQLVLRHHNRRFPTTQWMLFSLLLAQSRKLRELLRTAEIAKDGKRKLEITLTDRFVTIPSMESALKVLYGMPSGVFIASDLDEDLGRTGSEISTARMSDALSHAATGCLLHMQEIVLQGLQIASELLCWDNLELALSFGLESGFERAKTASAYVVPAYSTLKSRDSDPSTSSQVMFTPSSSTNPSFQPSSHGSRTSSSSESQRHQPPRSAHDLLVLCLDFIVRNFPESFALDLSARPLADVDRLPATAESKSPLSKSRLSRIQFGDHPSEAAARSGDHNVLLSTILLSIPFLWLDHLLARAGNPIARSMISIISERERRRNIVIQSKSVPWTERVDAKDYAWAEAGYEESIKKDENGKLSIVRRYTGIARDPNDEVIAEHTSPQE